MFLKNKDFFARPASAGPVVSDQQPDGAQKRKRLCRKSPIPMWKRVQKRLNRCGFVYGMKNCCRTWRFLDACSRETGRPEIHKQLMELREYLQNARFTVAVVGEFNRGKSTLVNKLLGRDVIPVSALPSTLLPIRVEGGRREELIWKRPGGETRYSVKPETWDTLEEEIGWDGKAKGD